MVVEYPQLEALSEAVAMSFCKLAVQAAKDGRTFSVALAGGHTPATLYQTIAEKHGKEIPWGSVHLFWGDERFVPHDSPDSNYRMVKETLLDNIAIPEANIHPIPTNFAKPNEAASAYSETIRTFFGSAMASFDLVYLGLGADGHTASLFPGMAMNSEELVIVTHSPVPPSVRISLSMNVLNAAQRVEFLVAGRQKQEITKKVLSRGPTSEFPASMVRPATSAIWNIAALEGGEK